jgi:Fe2+ transport system protein FeoA
MTPAVALRDLRPGQSAEVVSINAADAGRLIRLGSLGVVPGVIITVQQHEPACVIAVGETELSLDGEVTREIMTRVLN